ncbi:MAG: alpha/beta hydrolase [Sinobacteraceae bacterium]|nr:alpha/beta hydrolase [Nevskiaceae bacterium]
MLLLSGLLCDATAWSDVPARLADLAAVRVLSFPDFDSIGAMAQHTLELVSGRFAVAGHSMGARVALEVIHRAPQRVTGIALLNTGVHPVRPGEAESRGRLVALAREQGMRALAAAWLPPMMGASAGRVAALQPALIAMIERATPQSFAAQVKALLCRPDAQSVLSEIKVPTLLASGTADRWSPLAQHAQMQAAVAHATLAAIPDSGHMAPAEQPAAVAALLREWLLSVRRAAASTDAASRATT